MSGYCRGNLMMYAVAFQPNDMTMGYQVYCHLNVDLEPHTLDFNLLKRKKQLTYFLPSSDYDQKTDDPVPNYKTKFISHMGDPDTILGIFGQS